MLDIPPTNILSEHFSDLLTEKKVISAVFTTYRFDPAFFEQEILPVFFDDATSQAREIRLLQLEDSLRVLPGGVAVYYDINGLEASSGDAGGGRLDKGRIPVKWDPGVFHCKNIFLLCQSKEIDSNGEKNTSLIVSTLSANLTRSGWWENVEVCHSEVIESNSKSWMREELRGFIRSLKTIDTPRGHHPLEMVDEFLKNNVDQSFQERGGDKLKPHFWNGQDSVTNYLTGVMGPYYRGCQLEVISPYFDSDGDLKPLEELRDAFEPTRISLFLPKNEEGDAQIPKEAVEKISQWREASFGALPESILKKGESALAGHRFVHAKVYRFFNVRDKWDILFLGSPNLTKAAHQKGYVKNRETALLVQIDLDKKPEPWLKNQSVPRTFEKKLDAEDGTELKNLPLLLYFDWKTKTLKANWLGEKPSGKLLLFSRGLELGSLESLKPECWTDVGIELAFKVQNSLRQSAVFSIRNELEIESLVLVQEDGMECKPSLLLELKASDILRYWSLLTVEQRTAFLEIKASQINLSFDGTEFKYLLTKLDETESMFNRVAGFFHAFGCLERAVKTALVEGRTKEAEYRLFGEKYDSLGLLLQRLGEKDEKIDVVDRYLLLLSAQQILQQLPKDQDEVIQEFFKVNKEKTKLILDSLQKKIEDCKSSILEKENITDTKNNPNMPAFLDWFQEWFLKRAKVIGVPDDET